MTIEINHFSKEQTAILKGVGILLIVLHNFFHNLTPVIGENEFSFSNEIFWNFYRTLQASPENVLRALFSYFGHYGVQVFIFFSSYGLTRKYYQKPLIISQFLANRINKIYFSFLLCVVVYILLGLVKAEFIPDEKVLYWDSLLWKVLLVSNFTPGQALMPVGPWWFMPFIFQLYALYPWLLSRYQKQGYKFLILVSLTAILLESQINAYLITRHLNINYTVFGYLPLVCLGLFFASQDKIKIPVLSVWISLLLFILGNFNMYAWIFSNVVLTIIALAASTTLFKFLLHHAYTAQFLMFFGNISFYLFMVNGFLRTPFHHIAEIYHCWWIDNLAALASLLFSSLCAYYFSRLDKQLRTAFRSTS
jgi:peptidoglycan/LPS O-acetylase OafA/YrhL